MLLFQFTVNLVEIQKKSNFALSFFTKLWIKSANFSLHLLSPISDHVIVHLGSNSCAIFSHPLECTGVIKTETKVSSQLNYHVI